MSYLAITAVGRDRPGIVAEVTGTLFRCGCNLEETTMTRLRSEFAMMLLVRAPDEPSSDTLRSALEETAAKMDLSLVMRPLDPEEVRQEQAGSTGYILRVYGGDRPGIVYAVTSLLFERGLNITDLNTRVIHGASGPVYVLVLEVDIPSHGVAYSLRPELEKLAPNLDVDISFGEVELETL